MVQVIHFDIAVEFRGISERMEVIVDSGVVSDVTNIPQIHPLRSDFDGRVRSPDSVVGLSFYVVGCLFLLYKDLSLYFLLIYI